MSPVSLLTTKLFAPQPGAKMILRPRLLASLDRAWLPGKRLVLVCAPAGYGKTTVVGDWIGQSAQLRETAETASFAWLSLDPADNDPNLFLAYFAAALQQACPSLNIDPSAYLYSLHGASLQPALTELINRLADRAAPILLILDDYQFIRNPAVHEGIAFLLDHLPPQARLLLATRVDPSLPLHRYRARQQMVEVRADELRFTSAEMAQFFSQASGLELEGEDLHNLEDRLEGWAAGVQMAMLSFERQPDISRFISTLSGNRSFILDYLAEEVLNSQTEEVRRSLLQISILDQFCAPLCEAVTGEGPGAGDALIEGLLQANLFLTPLDVEHQWFRFHRLFADLLRVRLNQPQAGIPAEQQSDLHRRAAGWLEAHGFQQEAIQHALQAGDHERAADLVERNTITLLSSGKLHALLGWIERLPRETAERRPWLCLYQAWTLGFAGKPDEAERLIQRAEEGLAAGGLSPQEDYRLRYEVQAVRMMVRVSSGRSVDLAQMEALVQAPLPEEGAWARAALCWSWGYACRTAGRLEEACAAFDEMQRLGQEMGNLWTSSTGMVDLAAALRQRGRLRQAVQIYRQGLERLRLQAALLPGFAGRVESLLSAILYEQNELTEAHRLIESSLEHNRWWRNPNHDAHACLVRAQMALGAGDLEAARSLLESANEITAQAPVVLLLRSLLEALWVRCWLASGQIETALHWAEKTASKLDEPQSASMGEAQDTLNLALARVWISSGNKAEAWSLLKRIEEAARRDGRATTQIETLALQALAAEGKQEAFLALQRALVLAAPEGFVRLFLDLGEPMKLLLREYRSALQKQHRAEPPTVEEGLNAYIEKLLAAFSGEWAQLQPQPSRSSQQLLIEPLTERELEVLGCLAEGLSNPQIGARLYISTGTVKAHTAAIFRKLECANRTEAVVRAKDMGLI